MNRIHYILFICLGTFVLGCSPKGNKDETKVGKKSGKKIEKLMIKDIKEGTGKAADFGDLVLVEYKGSLTNGDVFDSNNSEERPERGPFAFKLGSNLVIQGWEEGIPGLKVGGERTLEIPYSKAYGENGRPPVIPPKADLIFDVKLLDIVKEGEEEKLHFEIKEMGEGKIARPGTTVKVHYTGRLVNGKKFDSSVDRDEPFEFELGSGQVIAGWEQGIEGMKVGEKRELRIPPALGYGARGAGRSIGPNQVLIFDVELLDVK